jgi:hypothetical protein
VPVRCIWLDVKLGDAQINAVARLLEVHGRLPAPEELRALGKQDPRYFGPDAQFRWSRAAEPPATDEGFASVERRTGGRPAPLSAQNRGVVLEYDGVVVADASGSGPVLRPEDVVLAPGCAETLAGYAAAGWLLFTHAWRPQVSSGETSREMVLRCFDRTRELLGLELETGFCPHPAGPPVCWCRKPIPGLVLEFAARRGVALERSIAVGRGPADRTLAERLGMTYRDVAGFFGRD